MTSLRRLRRLRDRGFEEGYVTEPRGDFNPMALCQAMMTSADKAAAMAAYASPEVRTLFEERAGNVEQEVLAIYFLGKPGREGKATITGIQAAGVA